MNATKQAFWLSLLLITLAYSGWYFVTSSKVIKFDDETLSQSADTIVTNLTVRRFDEQGKVINYLHTPEMQHISAQNTHLLKTPHLLLIQPGQPPWQIDSGKAKAIHGGEKITFFNHVVVHQNKSTHSVESTMKTEELIYFPKEKLAISNLLVRFEQPGSVVHSKGMKAYLANKRVKLLSKTRATYEPHQA